MRSSASWERASRPRSSWPSARPRSTRSCAWSASPPRIRAAASSAPRRRLARETFRLPVERIREGYYSDAYFNFTKELLEARGHCPRVTMQVFQKDHSILGGIDEAIAVLKLCSGQNTPQGAWED